MKRAIIIAAMLAAAGLAGAQMFAQLFGGETWTPAALNPVAWYKGDGNAKDAMGNYNGTWVGTEAYADGPTGQAFDFNGSSHINVPQIDGIMTVAFWADLSKVTNNGYFIGGDKVLVANYAQGVVFSPSPKTFHYFLSYPGYTTVVYEPSAGMEHFTFVTYGGSNDFDAYVNGVYYGSAKVGGVPAKLQVNYIARRKSGDFFKGKLGDILLFDRALTATEIKKLYDESVKRNGRAW